MTTTGFAAPNARQYVEFETTDGRNNFARVPAAALTNASGEAFGPGNPLATSSDGVSDAAVTTGSVTSAATVMTLNTAGFGGGSFQITNIGSGNTVSFEQSNDNTNWVALPVNIASNTYSNPVTGATATGIYQFVSVCAYVRARVSTYGSGTVAISATQKRARPVPDQTGYVALSAASAQIGYVLNSVGYTDSTTALGSSATYTGTSRSTASLGWAAKFKARAFTDQAGTLTIEQSVDSGTNWRTVGSVAVSAGVAANLSVDVTGAYGSTNLYRVKLVNGASAQGLLNLSSAFSAN